MSFEFTSREIDYYTITPRTRNGEVTYDVHAWDTYEDSSVLAGQPRKSWVDTFASLEDAQAEYPMANLSHPLLEPPKARYMGREDDAWGPIDDEDY